jgi:hypothetical protein
MTTCLRLVPRWRSCDVNLRAVYAGLICNLDLIPVIPQSTGSKAGSVTWDSVSQGKYSH